MTDKINYRDKNGCCSAATYAEQSKCKFLYSLRMYGMLRRVSQTCGSCGSYQAYLDGKEKTK